MLRIRDVYSSVADPGCLSRIRIFSIPDPNFFNLGSRIRIKKFKYFNPKNWFLSSLKYDPSCSSRIRIPFFTHPRSSGQKGIGSRIRIRNTGLFHIPDPVSLRGEISWAKPAHLMLEPVETLHPVCNVCKPLQILNI